MFFVKKKKKKKNKKKDVLMSTITYDFYENSWKIIPELLLNIPS